MSKVARCKFVCDSVTNYQGSKTARLRAVCGKEGENADFTQYTPNGTIEVTVNNEAPATDHFVPGKNYYVDFIETE